MVDERETQDGAAFLLGALEEAARKVQDLAFTMPAPNLFTPEFIIIANAMRLVAATSRGRLFDEVTAERERVAALEAAAQKALQALRRNQAAGLRIGDAILWLSSVLESGYE